MMRIITYECEECGTEVVVTERGGTLLRPIYCCGLEITEVSSVPLPKGANKRTVGKTVKTAKTAGKAVKNAGAERTTKTDRTAKKKTTARKSLKK
jgi:hypothetical protein